MGKKNKGMRVLVYRYVKSSGKLSTLEIVKIETAG